MGLSDLLTLGLSILRNSDTLEYGQVELLIHQINTALLSVVANSGCQSNDCAELSDCWFVSRFVASVLRMSTLHQFILHHQRLNSRSVTVIIFVNYVLTTVHLIYNVFKKNS